MVFSGKGLKFAVIACGGRVSNHNKLAGEGSHMKILPLKSCRLIFKIEGPEKLKKKTKISETLTDLHRTNGFWSEIGRKTKIDGSRNPEKFPSARKLHLLGTV